MFGRHKIYCNLFINFLIQYSEGVARSGNSLRNPPASSPYPIINISGIINPILAICGSKASRFFDLCRSGLVNKLTIFISLGFWS